MSDKPSSPPSSPGKEEEIEARRTDDKNDNEQSQVGLAKISLPLVEEGNM